MHNPNDASNGHSAHKPSPTHSLTCTISTSASSRTVTPGRDAPCSSITPWQPKSYRPSPFHMNKVPVTDSASKPAHKQIQRFCWPMGVLSGGVIIDMLEYLSHTAREADRALVLWLQKHYIEPFGRVDRLDGLIVSDESHM